MQSEGPPGVRGSRRDPSLLPLVRAAAGWYTTSPTTIVRSQLLWVCRRTMQGRDSQYGVYLVRLPNGSRPKQLLRDHITIVECGGLWGQRWETQSMRASTHAMRLVVSLRISGIRDQRRGDSLKYECQMRFATWDSKHPFDRPSYHGFTGHWLGAWSWGAETTIQSPLRLALVRYEKANNLLRAPSRTSESREAAELRCVTGLKQC